MKAPVSSGAGLRFGRLGQGPWGERRLGRPLCAMAASPGFQWPPLATCLVRCERGSVDVVCPPVLARVDDGEEDRVRAVALDVHRDFCEVAIVAEGRLRSAGRIKTRPEELELFARSLDRRDWLALEVTGNAWFCPMFCVRSG